MPSPRTRSIAGISFIVVAALGAAPGASAQSAGAQFKPVEMKMHDSMMSVRGRDTDVVFARKMIAHHQGAIDMSRVEIANGSDSRLKAMAQKSMDENAQGVRDLQRWLRRHGG